MSRRPFVVAATLSLLVLVAHLAFHLPALTDPTGAALPDGLRLTFPAINLLFAPLFDLWDGVTLLTLPQLHAFLLGALIFGAAWSVGVSIVDRRLDWRRATARLAVFSVGLALFVLGGVRWRRPMAHLDGIPVGWLVVDLHSHTNVSHDVKGWLQGDFDLEASRRWHARGGFGAFFVTDHNRIDGWQGKELAGAPAACPGEELSLWRAHIVVLGNTDSIPRGMYADSMAGLERIFQESATRWGGVTLASLPEYENHFAALPWWVANGVDGFEISNPAPRANRQPAEHRDSVVRLALRSGRWLAGVTDQHGMGATVQAWTLMPVVVGPGTSTDPIPHVCRQLVAMLASRGESATLVVERQRVRIDSAWPVFATFVAVPWEGWRAAGMWQVVSWLAWIWVIALLVAYRTKQAAP